MALTRRRPLYVVGPGTVVGRRGGRLVVTRDGVPVTSAPLAMVSEVVVFGTIPVTVPAMTALLAEAVPLVLLTADGRVRGRLEAPSATHVDLRRRQLELHADPVARLGVARALVRGKIHNQDVLLRRRATRSARPDDVWELAHRVAGLGTRVAEATSLAELNGLEGAASGAYFRGLRLLLDPALGFRRRERTDVDLVNVLINFCSALLREVVLGAVATAGLDPYVSFLHMPRAGRPTLAFDLMEEWRPVLLEPTVLALVGLRAVRSDDVAAHADVHAPHRAATRPWKAPSSSVPQPASGRNDVTARRDPTAPSDLTAGYPEPAVSVPEPAVGEHGRERPAGSPRLSPDAAAATVGRFRARLDAPARGWPQPGGRSYAAQIRAQALALRAWVDTGEPYQPFAWR